MQMALMYIIMGALFSFFAFLNMDETIWEPLPIIFLLFASFDFLIGFKGLTKKMQQRRDK